MSKDLNVSVLIDIYGDMLTEKQKDVMDLYYNEDLSLSEIAEHENISRQGVRDSIKRGEETLFELESKLGLSEKFSKLNKMMSEIKEKCELIKDECGSYGYARNILKYASDISETLKTNEDLF